MLTISFVNRCYSCATSDVCLCDVWRSYNQIYNYISLLILTALWCSSKNIPSSFALPLFPGLLGLIHGNAMQDPLELLKPIHQYLPLKNINLFHSADISRSEDHRQLVRCVPSQSTTAYDGRSADLLLPWMTDGLMISADFLAA